MKAFGKNLLLKPVTGKGQTDSGLYVPESARQSKNTCEIISVGDEVTEKLKVGQTVAFSTGHSFQFENVDYIIAEEKNILLVL